jgi:hypothetical protein
MSPGDDKGRMRNVKCTQREKKGESEVRKEGCNRYVVSPSVTVLDCPYKSLVLCDLLTILLAGAGLALVRASPAEVSAHAAVVAAGTGVTAGSGGSGGDGEAFLAREVSWEGGVVVRGHVLVHDLVVGVVSLFVSGVLLNPIGGRCDALVGVGAFEVPHGLVSVCDAAAYGTHQGHDLFLEGTSLLDVPLIVANAGYQGFVLFHIERLFDPGGERLVRVEDAPHGFGVTVLGSKDVLGAIRAAVNGKVKAVSA